ncbi:MAG: tRNA (adenosine(37)-N6)-threonylcarbamoyltransferase complex transferase subunit TsaD [Nitrospirae bacterium]|nr:MAG: tRNA (adenosine(37)-N6)-threonylcarbamoyltransferase complex transferase subunit TsaD [Nitrospirota bacterium]
MYILAIDTSCDDTSVAVVKEGRGIISNIVSSQANLHSPYGGIVPELASRKHIEMIGPTTEEALRQAALKLDDIDLIAACHGPGLIGSLLVGLCFAKALSYTARIPLVSVNHLEGHIFAANLLDSPPEFPFLALIVSGGHTSIVRVDGFQKYRELGKTRDDAAGEAYDKVAKLLGLSYPGGPVIDGLAEGIKDEIAFPRPMLHEGFDMSFSGLKTAVMLHVKQLREKGNMTDEEIKRVCASFQEAVVDVLVRKTERAALKEGLKTIVLSGGVAANRRLRQKMTEMAEERGFSLIVPPASLCTDNAAMIAAAGYYYYKKGLFAPLDITATAHLPIGRS